MSAQQPGRRSPVALAGRPRLARPGRGRRTPPRTGRRRRRHRHRRHCSPAPTPLRRAYDAIFDADFERARSWSPRPVRRRRTRRAWCSKRRACSGASSSIPRSAAATPPSRGGRTAAIDRRRGVGGARAAAGGGLVLPRRRLRRPRAMAGARGRSGSARPATAGEVKHGARSGAGPRARRWSTRSSGSGSTSTYADVAPTAAKILRVPADAAGRQSRPGPGADAADAAGRPAPRRRGRVPAPRRLLLVREPRRRRHRRCCASWSSGIRATRTSAAPSPSAETVYLHDPSAVAGHLARAGAAGRCRRASTKRRWPGPRRTSAIAQALDALGDTDLALAELDAVCARRRRPRHGASPRASRSPSAASTIASASAPRPRRSCGR